MWSILPLTKIPASWNIRALFALGFRSLHPPSGKACSESELETDHLHPHPCLHLCCLQGLKAPISSFPLFCSWKPYSLWLTSFFFLLMFKSSLWLFTGRNCAHVGFPSAWPCYEHNWSGLEGRALCPKDSWLSTFPNVGEMWRWGSRAPRLIQTHFIDQELKFLYRWDIKESSLFLNTYCIPDKLCGFYNPGSIPSHS